MPRKPAVLLAATLLAAVGVASSQDRTPVPVVVDQATTMRAVLFKQNGRPVTLMLDSGQELSGVVKEVGDKVVHLASLTGKEFYDAVVDLDEVTAVVVRAR
jgi:type II secretory pathway predicted ATPase ExeA